MTDITGEVLDERFELKELVGSGAMGSVFRARDRRTGGWAAVKVLRAEAIADDPGGERFGREVRVLKTLAHPGVVEYVSHGQTEDGAPWLAMEWLEGEDLSQRLDAGWEPSLDEALTLGRAIAEALAVAHAAGVVHRDVKAANVFLPTADLADAKLLDFGVARTLGAALTPDGNVIGTPDTMAPEQARGQQHVDARADIYALGCILFQCLTSRLPFEQEQGLGVLVRKVLDDPPRVNALLADFEQVPAAVDELIHRMLARDADLRPADGAAAAAELAKLQGVAPAATPALAAARTLTERERRVLGVVASVTADEGAFGAVREVVEAAGGAVERLAGGFWVTTLTSAGGPSDVAAAAVRCALDLHARLAAHGEGLDEVPVVVATGRGVLSASPTSGEAIDRAVELLTGRRVPGVTVDAVTAELLPGSFVVEPGGPPFRVTGTRADAVGVRTVLGRPTPCVGRDDELARLEAIADAALDGGPPAAALVLGAPGIGKSRVCQALVERLRERLDVELLVGAADERRSASPYGWLRPALAGWLEIPSEERTTRQRRALRARLQEDLGREDVEAPMFFLGELVGLSMPMPDDPALAAARRDAHLMTERVEATFAEWLQARARQRPPGAFGKTDAPAADLPKSDPAHARQRRASGELSELASGSVSSSSGKWERQRALPRTLLVLWLEDLHASDMPALELLETALHAAGGPWLLLGTARPELLARTVALWTADAVAELMTLDALDDGAARALAAAVLPDAGAEAIEGLVARSAGNPFYLEEFLRAAATGADPDELPDTVLGMVESRLWALDADARRALRAASVYGMSFWSGGLLALLGGESEREALAGWLEELRRRELVVPAGATRFEGEQEYRFAAELVRSAAYAMLPESDRQAGHLLAAEWLQAQGERDEVVLAKHYRLGGEPQRAADHYADAARRALDGGDPRAAAALLEEREEALTELQVPDDDRRWAEGWLVQSRVHLALGEIEEADHWARAVGNSGMMYGWRDLVARGMVQSGAITLLRGDLKPARDFLVDGFQAAATADEPDIAAECALELAALSVRVGHAGDALRWFRMGAEAYERLEHVPGVARCMLGIADVARRLGDTEACRAQASEALRLFEMMGSARGRVQAMVVLGDADRADERPEDALRRYEEAVEEARTVSHGAALQPLLASGRVLLALGRDGEARAAFEASAGSAERHDRRLELAWSRAGLAATAADASDADETLRSALELEREAGGADADGAELLEAAGRRAGELGLDELARAALRRARDQYEALEREGDYARVSAMLGAL